MFPVHFVPTRIYLQGSRNLPSLVYSPPPAQNIVGNQKIVAIEYCVILLQWLQSLREEKSDMWWQ